MTDNDVTGILEGCSKAWGLGVDHGHRGTAFGEKCGATCADHSTTDDENPHVYPEIRAGAQGPA